MPDASAGMTPRPESGRTFTDTRRVRLSDMDARGRVRLDALARLLQDIAIDDVQETGWGLPDHLWFVRAVRIDLASPFLEDAEIELTTWCNGHGAAAAGRRWSLIGDQGGNAEVDSVWIHLDAAGRPARLGAFGVYAEAAEGRPVTTRLALPDPPEGAVARRWPLRTTDLDRHGHVNNAIFWAAVEDTVVDDIDLRAPLLASLDYRAPLDDGDDLQVVAYGVDAGVGVGLLAGSEVRAVAVVRQR